MNTFANHMTKIRGHLAYTRCHWWKYRRIVGYAILAPQDVAQEVQVRSTSDSVNSDRHYIFINELKR